MALYMVTETVFIERLIEAESPEKAKEIADSLSVNIENASDSEEYSFFVAEGETFVDLVDES